MGRKGAARSVGDQERARRGARPAAHLATSGYASRALLFLRHRPAALCLSRFPGRWGGLAAGQPRGGCAKGPAAHPRS